MDKIVVAGIVLIVLIFGAYFLSTTFQKQAGQNIPSENVEDIPVEISDIPSAESASLPPSIPCEQQSNNWNKDGCYREQALTEVDETICQNIVDLGVKNNCLIEIAIDKAEANCAGKTIQSEQSSCHIAEAGKICPMVKGVTSNQQAIDLCYQYIAADLGDSAVCTQIKDSGIRQNCEKKSQYT